LNYAVKNRQEWELKGREIVADMITKAARISVTNESEQTDARRQILQRLSQRSMDVDAAE
jgi:hypothetical protein